MSIKPATRFENSKVRRRFLTQIFPLARLLEKHGLCCAFLMPSIFRITAQERQCMVFVEDGERRFDLDAMIFVMAETHREGGLCMTCNQLSGVVRVLEKWGYLARGAVSEEDLGRTLFEACAACCHCGVRLQALKQCALSKQDDKELQFPAYEGFYCCKTCQTDHWAVHRRRHM